jgi:ATP-binding cassette subfamily B protein RaxB
MMTLHHQSETSECGLACLSIALEQLGAPIDLSELRRKHVISTRGLTVKELVDIAATLGLVGRAVRCELEELADLQCPAVLHWGLNHFVVLEKVKRSVALIHDPAVGRSRFKLDQISDQFTGIAIELSPAPEFKKRKKESPLSLWSWFRFPKAMVSSLVQILVLSFLLQAYIVASPFYMQLAIDQAALKGDHQLLLSLAIGFGLFGLFNVGASVLRGLVTLQLTALLNWDMTLRLFRQLVRLPLPWFQRRKLADVLSRFDAIAPVRNLISGSLVATVVDGVLAIVTLVMMLIFAPSLALVVVVGLVLYIALRWSFLPLSIKLGMESLTAHIAENGKRIETVRAIQTIKVMGAENARESDWANKFANTIKRDLALGKVDLYLVSARGTVDTGVNLILIFLGAKAIIEGSMTVGVLYAFMAYSNQFSARASALFDQYMNWRLTDMYSYRLADIVLTPKETGIDETNIGQPVIEGALAFTNLSFAYSQQEAPIFRQISFEVAAGEYVAIIGPSGAGKSTLLKVLCGLYPASAGEVHIDGRSLTSWGPKAVRGALGVVMQDDELLTGTIAENVAFFDEQIAMERVWACLRQACLDEDVLKMPMRADTFLGDMGSSLSGGQKQRLLLARALYRQPCILVLDEATSHLDVARESQINATLKALAITRIVVAHRHETILSADRVICLDKGNIVFDKTRDEFLQMLMQSQAVAVEDPNSSATAVLAEA